MLQHAQAVHNNHIFIVEYPKNPRGRPPGSTNANHAANQAAGQATNQSNNPSPSQQQQY